MVTLGEVLSLATPGGAIIRKMQLRQLRTLRC